MASQSEQFAGIHDVPRFVCDRVELVADLAVDGSCDQPGPGESLRLHEEAYGRKSEPDVQIAFASRSAAISMGEQPSSARIASVC
jgi:hypothetical protein